MDDEFTCFLQQFLGEGTFAKVRHTSAFCKLLAKWEERKMNFGGGPDERVRLDMGPVSRHLDLGVSGLKVRPELKQCHRIQPELESRYHLKTSCGR